jgi:hypothetical protein
MPMKNNSSRKRCSVREVELSFESPAQLFDADVRLGR